MSEEPLGASEMTVTFADGTESQTESDVWELVRYDVRHRRTQNPLPCLAAEEHLRFRIASPAERSIGKEWSPSGPPRDFTGHWAYGEAPESYEHIPGPPRVTKRRQFRRRPGV